MVDHKKYSLEIWSKSCTCQTNHPITYSTDYIQRENQMFILQYPCFWFDADFVLESMNTVKKVKIYIQAWTLKLSIKY